MYKLRVLEGVFGVEGESICVEAAEIVEVTV